MKSLTPRRQTTAALPLADVRLVPLVRLLLHIHRLIVIMLFIGPRWATRLSNYEVCCFLVCVCVRVRGPRGKANTVQSKLAAVAKRERLCFVLQRRGRDGGGSGVEPDPSQNLSPPGGILATLHLCGFWFIWTQWFCCASVLDDPMAPQ